jgi:hypothetical protein
MSLSVNLVWIVNSFVSKPGKTRGAIGFAAVAGVPKGHLRHFKIKKAVFRFFFEF